MNYEESIQWLFDLLPAYHRDGKVAYKENLDNISKFCSYLGNPQNQFKSIHIAGTNGKGSTAHMLASILQEAHYKTALHTSPHLKDFRERNMINGEMMSKEFVIDFIQEHQEYIQELHASFFEVIVAMGFQYFAKNQVDIAVIETGLGGRLDATNIIHPILSIITNIGLDHTAILGETLRDIALEKAGIIKDKTPVVIGVATDETKGVFIHKAEQHKSPIYFAQELELPEYTTDLKGIYQEKNKRTVLTAIEIVQNSGFNITKNNIQEGLNNVKNNTDFRGRWDILQEKPLIVADTAHNPDGIRYITKQIHSTNYENLHLVLGFANDKDVKQMLSLFPKNAQYYFCQANIPRKMPIEDLKHLTQDIQEAKYFYSVREALAAAKINAANEDMIYVGGSTFVVAEII